MNRGIKIYRFLPLYTLGSDQINNSQRDEIAAGGLFELLVVHCINIYLYKLKRAMAKCCRPGPGISPQLVATMPDRIWRSSWMLPASNTLLIGFHCHFFGKPWTRLMNQPDLSGGLFSFLFSIFLLNLDHVHLSLIGTYEVGIAVLLSRLASLTPMLVRTLG